MRPACYLLLVFVFACAAMPALASTKQAGQPAQNSQPGNEQAAPSAPKSGASTTPTKATEAKPKAEQGKPGPNKAPDPWAMLMNGANSEKFRDRSDAITALSILRTERKAIAVVANALSDKEETIRVLAATTLGDMKARPAIPKLREAIEDPSPEVSFAAAQALWKMGDRSGRDIFYDVLDGQRKVKPGLIKSKMREARKDMHDPKALALIGVNEVSGAFLGPFSMGVSMAEEYAKNNGTSVQALCAELLALDDSRRTTEELTYALGDANWTVRATAARSIARLNYRGAMGSLKDMMQNDKSQPARFAAAAAIIHLQGIAGREPAAPTNPASASANPTAKTIAVTR
jgi:HEAT repeat protein